MKCLSRDRNENPCRNNSINATRFCKLHQYMCDYTNEMLENLKLCKGCNKMYYFENENKTCENCRTRIKKEKEVILCKKEGCKFKKSDENDYCGKHQINIFIEQTISQNKKICKNYIRGCRSQLNMDYTFSKCEECLNNYRIKDKTNRKNAIENNIVGQTTRICTTCFKHNDISEFKNDITELETKTCKTCREQNKKQIRNKEKRNFLSRININQSFSSYIKEAKRRNFEFKLSKDIFNNIVKQNCHYCNEINTEKKFNGIDRIDSNNGYILENCVSCCSLCNYLKNKMPIDTFIKRVQHIVTYSTSKNSLFMDYFPDFISGNYKGYIISAKNRNIDFVLSETMFNNIVKNNCYMCGKRNNETHQNGIDRYCNSIGYIEDNCKSCCNTCNMMKNRFSYNDIMNKFNKIMYNDHFFRKIGDKLSCL